MAYNHIQLWPSTKTFIPQLSLRPMQWQAPNCPAIIVLSDSLSPWEQHDRHQLKDQYKPWSMTELKGNIHDHK